MPKLSIVFATRNDDYGGNLINRIETTIRVLSHLTRSHRFPVELVVVEYNPADGKLPLSLTLHLPAHPYLTIRFITVPRSFHKRITGDSRLAFFEYIAKNIGIRRSKGSWILSTNQDIILSSELIQYLKTNRLLKSNFYRIDRHDVARIHFDVRQSPESILKECAANTYAIWRHNRKYYPGSTRKVLIQSFLDGLYVVALKLTMARKRPQLFWLEHRFGLHEAAAGDFLLMHKSAWKKISGYEEQRTNNYIDALALHVLRALGFTQTILPFPIYHIDHEADKRGRPTTSLMEYYDTCLALHQARKPYGVKRHPWGFSRTKFNEITR